MVLLVDVGVLRMLRFLIDGTDLVAMATALYNTGLPLDDDPT
jgi:hypothetical protein